MFSRKSKMATTSVASRKAEEDNFIALFPEIVSAVVSSPHFSNDPEIAARIKELLEYNSSGGNKTRGLMTVYAYQMLAKPEEVTEESMRLARVLGWCVELFQTSLIILDDIGDNSSTRRGKPCWYRRPGVGVLAVNDSLLLLTIVFDLLKDHFGEKACYPDILYIFNQALRHTCMGQYPTILLSKDYEQFTMEHYKKFSDHKRTFYTFKLPVCTSLLLAGKPYQDAFNNVEDILVDMGVLISMQNDYLDCYGDESIAGKAGNDIQEGTCTWLAVSALQRCNTAQRAEFIACYGSANEEFVKRIKRLYTDLQLPALCREAERKAYDSIVKRLNALPSDNVLPPTLLLTLFQMVFNMKAD